MSAFIGTAVGFNLLDQGITWSTEAYFQYRLGSLPGGIMGGLAYGFSGEFDTAIGRLSNLPPPYRRRAAAPGRCTRTPGSISTSPTRRRSR